MEVRRLPLLVIPWALLPRPSLDNKLLAGGIYLASQVSVGLFRAPYPHNAGLGSVRIYWRAPGKPPPRSLRNFSFRLFRESGYFHHW